MRARLDPQQAAQIEAGPPGLPGLVAALFEDVEAASALRLQKDTEFFNVQGTPERGAVLRIGRVGAIAWDQPRRALIQTPEGLRGAVGVEPIDATYDQALSLELCCSIPTIPRAPLATVPKAGEPRWPWADP